MKRIENLQNSDEGHFFFFEEQPKIRKKDASVSVITFFFLGDHIKTGQNDEKIFQHRSKTPQELRHFQIEFKTFALFLVFLQEVKT